MFLKKLFYASASILMLATAFHLGARSAGAQTGIPDTAGCEAGADTWSAVVGRTLFYRGGQGFTSWPQSIPGTSQVVACSSAGGEAYVVLANGDCFWADTPSSPWVLRGNLFGGATPAQSQSWGAVKVKGR